MKNGHFALAAIFIIGNTIINLPFGKGIENAIAGFFLCVVASLPLFLMLSRVQANAKSATLSDNLDEIFGKMAGRILAVVFSLFCLLCGISCMRNFISFVDVRILSLNGSFLPSIIFTSLAVVFCFVTKGALIKFSFIGLILTALAEVFLFICSLPQIDFENLLPLIGTDVKGIFYQGISYFGMSFGECTVLLPFFMGYTRYEKKHTYKMGLLFGAGLLLLCLIHTVGLFGYTYTGTLKYPYALAIGTVTAGDKLMRLEGFSYIIYFFSALVKTSVCIIGARDSIKNITGKYTRYSPVIIGLILISFSAFNNIFRPIDFIKIAPFFIIPAVCLPTALLVGYEVKNHIRCRCKTK